MKETPPEERTPELHDLYTRRDELSAQLSALAIQRAAIDAEWTAVTHERLAVVFHIRDIEDGPI